MNIPNLDAVEVKILCSAIVTSIAAPVDFFIKFLIPIASGIAWVFLKPYVEKWRRNYFKNKKKKDEEHKDSETLD